VHGLVSAARATGDGELRAAAELAARWFLDRLPDGDVPPWDFDAPAGGPADASAGAIVASALLDLGWRAEASALLEALAGSCLNRGPGDGVLLHCCYRRPIGLGLDCATAWGDFFFLDALVHAVEPESRPDPLDG
jgi:unsaturated chondroitin disaccharide hydrolase